MNANIPDEPPLPATTPSAAVDGQQGPRSLRPISPVQALLAEPQRYGFFQAVRLLFHAEGLADLRSGGREAVRFSVSESLAFPSGEIHDLQRDPAGIDAAHRMTVNFFGLTGPMGVLPRHYTRWLIARARARDAGPRDFFELFNHRLLLLFWHAWRKHRPEIALEFGLGQGVFRHLYDLVGMGTPALFERLYPRVAPHDGHAGTRLPAAALGYYSGLVSQRPHGMGTLSQVVGEVVGAAATVQACLGTWQTVPARDRTRLGQRAHQLGAGCVLGARFWDRQCTLQLRIGPLDRARFESLLPSGRMLAGVVELVRLLTGLALDLRIKLVLRAEQVPPLRLGAAMGTDASVARLGWNTWLGGRRSAIAADDVEFHFSAMGAESWQ